MAALGRLLQVIGWLWLVAGFALPALDLAEINPFPGLILIFVARALRTQAARNAPPEPAAEEQAPEERILNTDRVRVEPQPSPKPPPPSPQPVTIPRQTDPRPSPSAPSERESLIERIAEAGREAEADLTQPDLGELDVTAPRGSAKPMSSAEMIAEARRRWNTDKRPGRS
jgi:hypothetical protein